MAKLVLPGISNSDLSTLVLDQKELVYDLNNNIVVYGDGTATGGIPFGGISALNMSAGTTSSNATNFVFSNSNGVSFGLNGKTITASVGAGAADGFNRIVAGTQTAGTLATVVFSNSNGISFGMSNSSVITAQHNGLTTAMQSDAGSQFIYTTAGLNLTNISATINSNSISLSVGNYLTTAMQSNAATISNINVSAGTTSNNLSALTFANSNGVSFGLNAGTLTATVKTDYQTSGAYLTTARASNDAIGLNSALTANGVSVTANSSGLSLNFPAFLTTAALSNHSHNFATTTTNGSVIIVATTNSAGATIAVPPFLTTAQAPGAYLTTARASNDAIGLNTTQSNVTWTVNSSGLSLDARNYAGTATAATNATFTLNSNGLSLSVAAPGAGGAGNTIQGGYSNIQLFTNTVTVAYAQSTYHVVPFNVNENLSFDYIRFMALPGVSAASTTAATTGNATFSCGYTKTHYIGLFTMATGANSDSLQLFKSTGFTENFSNNIACAANSTQFSYSNRWTLPCSSGNYGFTYDYSSSAASINQNSANVTGLTGTKFIEIPFGTSLTPGRYWLMYGASSTTATQSAGTTIGVRNAVTYNLGFVSQAAQSIGTFGAATSNIYGPMQGLGSFTTVGGATTNSLHWTKVTVSANHPMLSFNLMRSA